MKPVRRNRDEANSKKESPRIAFVVEPKLLPLSTPPGKPITAHLAAAVSRKMWLTSTRTRTLPAHKLLKKIAAPVRVHQRYPPLPLQEQWKRRRSKKKKQTFLPMW